MTNESVSSYCSTSVGLPLPAVVKATNIKDESHRKLLGGEGWGEGAKVLAMPPLTPTLSPKKYLIQNPTDGHADTTSWEREPGKNWLAELSEAKHWSLGFDHWSFAHPSVGLPLPRSDERYQTKDKSRYKLPGGEGWGEGALQLMPSPLTPTLSHKMSLIQNPTDGHACAASWEREPGKNWLAEFSEAKHWSLRFGIWSFHSTLRPSAVKTYNPNPKRSSPTSTTSESSSSVGSESLAEVSATAATPDKNLSSR